MPSLPDSKFCLVCKKTFKKDSGHFIKLINKRGIVNYKCKENYLKKIELKKNKPKVKWCDSCKKRFEMDHFIKHIYNTGNSGYRCKINYKQPPVSRKGKYQPRTKSLIYGMGTEEYKRDGYLRHKYDIGLEFFNLKLIEQNNCCAICGKHESNFSKNLAVDHNHKTGKVRGLLCKNCNIGIGHFKDDISLINNAIEYLNKYK